MKDRKAEMLPPAVFKNLQLNPSVIDLKEDPLDPVLPLAPNAPPLLFKRSPLKVNKPVAIETQSAACLAKK